MGQQIEPQHRNAMIDAWRGILIGAVLCFHYLVRWAPPLAPQNVYSYNVIYSSYWQIGAYGVEVFFVISGLVITMTLLRSHDVLDFIFRRFSRLYPVLAICICITYATTSLRPISPDFHHSLRDFALAFTGVPAYLHASYIDAAYWSLAVEFKFYFLVALAFGMLRQKFWLAFAVMGFALGAANASSLPMARFDFFAGAQYLPLFLFGMAAWYAIFETRMTPALWLGAAAFASLPHLFPVLTINDQFSSIAAIAVGAAILLMLGSITLRAQVPLGPLPYLGRISYSLYLLHQNIGVTIIAVLKRSLSCPDMVAFGAAAATTIGLAALVYQFVEIPVQKFFRERYLKWRPQLEIGRQFVEAT